MTISSLLYNMEIYATLRGIAYPQAVIYKGTNRQERG